MQSQISIYFYVVHTKKKLWLPHTICPSRLLNSFKLCNFPSRKSLPLSFASLKHLIFLSNFYNLQVYGGNFYSFSRELSSFIDIVTCLQQASIFEMDFVPLSLTLLRAEHIYSILYEIYWFIMQIASANAYFFCLFLSSSPSPFSSISLLWNSFCLCVNSDLFFAAVVVFREIFFCGFQFNINSLKNRFSRLKCNN